jgi:hypothetical protein
MNLLDDTFMEITQLWWRLEELWETGAIDQEAILELRQALHNHGAELVAVKRESVLKLRARATRVDDPSQVGNLPD